MRIKSSILYCSAAVLVAVCLGLYFADSPGDHPTGVREAETPGIDLTRTAAAPLSTQPGGVTRHPFFARPLQWKEALKPDIHAHGSTAEQSAIASAPLTPDAIRPLKTVAEGDEVVFELGETTLVGTIKRIRPNDEGFAVVGGKIGEAQQGSFHWTRNLQTQAMRGQIIDREHKLVYEVTAVGDQMVLQKKPFDAALCAMPRPNRLASAAAASAAAKTPQALTVPILDSRPESSHVLYLDFDGETVIDPNWNGGFAIVASSAVIGPTGLAMTAAQITDVWQRVAEDYQSFDVTVTTSRARYNSAPVGQRAMAIITPTDSWYSSYVGGVAYLRSYLGPSEGFSSTIPCWVFNHYTESDMALTISHELGHMVGLSHDGTSYYSYYAGHDDYTTRSWGPIMGAPWDHNVVQWSKGEYPNANNFEDDFDVVSTLIFDGDSNSTGYAADDFGDDTAHATALDIVPTVLIHGVVNSSTDVDVFSFNADFGAIAITADTSVPNGPNLDPEITLLNSTGGVVTSATHSDTSMAAVLNYNVVAPGVYYLVVRGRGNPPVFGTTIGYTSYSSAGAFTLSGSYVPLVEPPSFTLQPVPVTVNQGGRVTLTGAASSYGPRTYQWWRRVNGVVSKLVGKTTGTLVIASAQPGDLGDYWLEATNSVGTSKSDEVAVTVRYKPIITQQPTPSKQTVNQLTNVSYQVVANGTAPMTYLWKHNNVVMPGQTNAMLTLNSVGWYDSGTYSVVVSNALGSVASTVATLTVTAEPLLAAPLPPTKHLLLGGTATLTASVVGTTPITYQWLQDGNPVTGATSPTLKWVGIKATHAGSYTLRATNGVNTVTTSAVVVDVQSAPVIDTQPATSFTVNDGDPFALTCVGHSNVTVNYQWQLNSLNIAGANSSSYNIPAAHWAHRGVYRCLVSNDVGTVTSKTCSVTVTSPPVIVTPPVATKIATNGTGVLKVVAGGTGTLKYQWYHDGNPITGAVASTLTLAKANPLTTNGGYYVTVSIVSGPMPGSVSSTPVPVTVEAPPAVTAIAPAASIIGVGDSVTLVPTVTGAATLTYQWQKNNVNIAGATSHDLSLTNAALADTASYRVVVTNDVGKYISAAAKVTVLVKPSIVTPPVDTKAFEYQSATFSVTASGSATLTYKWFKNGVLIPGATSTVLRLTGVRQATPSDTFTVQVSNGAGSATSLPATLTVLPIPTPVLSDVRPQTIVAGSKVLLTGTNLDWVTSITLGSKVISFVKNHPTELLATIPAGIASGNLTVTTRSGSATWPMVVATANGTPQNDKMVDATLMFKLDSWFDSKNFRATSEANESISFGATTWVRWRSPLNGKIRFNTTGTDFAHRVMVFSGPSNATSPAQLTLIGSAVNDYDAPFYDPDYTPFEEVVLTVVAGNDYYVSVDALTSYSFYNSMYAVSRVGFYHAQQTFQ